MPARRFNSTIVYNPANGSFTAGPMMDTARERHTATLITIGPNRDKVLIVGGRAKGNGSNYTTHATYQFCTATACTASQPGIAKRHSHAAVGITISASDIDVLVSGGSDGNNDLATSDVFDSLDVDVGRQCAAVHRSKARARGRRAAVRPGDRRRR